MKRSNASWTAPAPPPPEIKYVVKYKDGYMTRLPSSLAKTKGKALMFVTREEAEGKARARYQVHRLPGTKRWKVEEYAKKTVIRSSRKIRQRPIREGEK